MVISSRGSAKVADRSPFKIRRELKSILGDETIEVTKIGCGDLIVELKLNEQAKKLGAISTFLANYQVTRRKSFSVTDLHRLFREVNPSHIVGSLKELSVYGNI
ncbi:hypothetical protein PoB_002376100 [Plakobranchus ocellatus]|uniref:Uncharacterized protein n=1 Tax=Plakobranchus ocellatus TaxID=259542 RepID=A0AAV3ZRX8_9GAST|nr:hypothetical protein PoB_002376100 [Plakobranchus ocellatus]